MKYCAIEGIIASGKSTLIDYITKHQQNVSCFQEPVAKFQKYQSKFSSLSHNPLRNSYERSISDASIAQCHIIDISEMHYSKLNLLAESNKKDILITERSVLSPLMFIACYYYLDVFSPFVTDYVSAYFFQKLMCNANMLLPDIFIYLDIEPVLCQERIKKRSRVGEEHCSLSYQEMLSRCHKECLSIFPNVHIIQITDQSVEKLAEQVSEIIAGEIEKDHS